MGLRTLPFERHNPNLTTHFSCRFQFYGPCSSTGRRSSSLPVVTVKDSEKTKSLYCMASKIQLEFQGEKVPKKGLTVGRHMKIRVNGEIE